MSRVLAVALALLAAQASAADTPPGVVGIYTSTGSVGGQGTGFVISAAGEIATAYHVIHGAQRVDVTWGGSKFSDVVVARAYPEVDVAVLRIPRLPAGLTPLRLAATHKSWAAGDAVQVFGYPRGVADQRYDGTVTQSGTWRSEQIRDEQQRRLFRVEGIELVPLDVTIYSGISGGPILRGGEVIGILSGSLGQGRGIAWGIPVGYLPLAKPLERRASQMQAWPAFAMTRDWSTMRSNFRIESAASRLIDEYFAALDELAANYDELATKNRMAQAGIMLARRLFEDAMAKSPTGVPSASEGEVIGGLLFPNMEAVAKAHMRNGEVESKLKNALGRILGYVEKNYSGLPRTARNLQAAVELDASARDLARRHAALRKEAAIDPALMDMIGTFQQLAALDERDKPKLAAGMRDGMRKFELFLANQTGSKGLQARNASLRRYQEIGEYVQSVFSRPQDLVSEPRTFSSHRHAYTVTYPSGWVEWSPELSKHLPLAPVAGLDMYFVRTGYFGDERPMSGLQILTTNGDVRPASPLNDQLVAAIRAAFETTARSSLPGLRHVTATRTAFGAYPAVLIQASFDSEIQPAYMHNALVLGPGRMVWVTCTYRIRSDIEECRAITRSVQFR